MAVLPEKSSFSAAFTDRCSDIKVELESRQEEIDKMKAEPPARQDGGSNDKLAKLFQTHDADVCALQKKLRVLDLSVESLQPQYSTRDDSASRQQGELQEVNIALYNGAWTLASLFSILLSLHK